MGKGFRKGDVAPESLGQIRVGLHDLGVSFPGRSESLRTISGFALLGHFGNKLLHRVQSPLNIPIVLFLEIHLELGGQGLLRSRSLDDGGIYLRGQLAGVEKSMGWKLSPHR